MQVLAPASSYPSLSIQLPPLSSVETTQTSLGDCPYLLWRSHYVNYKPFPAISACVASSVSTSETSWGKGLLLAPNGSHRIQAGSLGSCLITYIGKFPGVKFLWLLSFYSWFFTMWCKWSICCLHILNKILFILAILTANK